MNIFTNPKETKYIIKKIEYFREGFYASQISNNEKYLAYGIKEYLYNGNEQTILKIYDIQLDKIIKEFKFVGQILVCQFTSDSSQLYVGCQYGYVYGYDKNFKQILKLKLYSHIYHIIPIANSYLITWNRDKTITKIDVKRKKQIFKQRGDAFNIANMFRVEDYVDAMDYNQNDDLVLIGYNKYYQLWDCKNRRNVFKQRQQNKNNVQQIQFINNYQNVLTLDVGSNLYKWEMNYINKTLIKIQEFRVPCEIQSFYSVNQDQNVIMICDGYLKVVNIQGETIYTLYHETTRFNVFFDNRQPENLGCINIRDRYNIFLAIQQ